MTVVHIDGPIKPEELTELQGHMGIPRFGLRHEKDKDGSKGGKTGSKPETTVHPENMGNAGGEY